MVTVQSPPSARPKATERCALEQQADGEIAAQRDREIPGRHAIYYHPEPGGLVEAVETALRDKDRLRAMAFAARDHVLAHHTPRAIVDHVIETGLAAGERIKQCS